jgi:hypothetical protein
MHSNNQQSTKRHAHFTSSSSSKRAVVAHRASMCQSPCRMRERDFSTFHRAALCTLGLAKLLDAQPLRLAHKHVLITMICALAQQLEILCQRYYILYQHNNKSMRHRYEINLEDHYLNRCQYRHHALHMGGKLQSVSVFLVGYQLLKDNSRCYAHCIITWERVGGSPL